ncbi:hypothetical protein SeSPB_B0028 [Salmonella enterica subsp. enterica serovar Saintpaul str. SARA29]|nr:hypothetical protein SeSPB_B0028 [Salmonella enterica subsp. enterica serovar Saintpaul str. SARA29]
MDIYARLKGAECSEIIGDVVPRIAVLQRAGCDIEMISELDFLRESVDLTDSV